MAHIKTRDNSQSICTEYHEFDVCLAGADNGPTDYCGACGAAEPTWEIVTDDEFYARYPL